MSTISAQSGSLMAIEATVSRDTLGGSRPKPEKRQSLPDRKLPFQVPLRRIVFEDGRVVCAAPLRGVATLIRIEQSVLTSCDFVQQCRVSRTLGIRHHYWFLFAQGLLDLFPGRFWNPEVAHPFRSAREGFEGNCHCVGLSSHLGPSQVLRLGHVLVFVLILILILFLVLQTQLRFIIAVGRICCIIATSFCTWTRDNLATVLERYVKLYKKAGTLQYVASHCQYMISLQNQGQNTIIHP